ncbi:hypothetical protein F4780DRAFT_780850 [Xylariomycetidae sp. FL0641]|nr:hypothetical protein F4780DRAFT_780850 [Xylariomycetidae sp. FL0641]
MAAWGMNDQFQHVDGGAVPDNAPLPYLVNETLPAAMMRRGVELLAQMFFEHERVANANLRADREAIQENYALLLCTLTFCMCFCTLVCLLSMCFATWRTSISNNFPVQKVPKIFSVANFNDEKS